MDEQKPSQEVFDSGSFSIGRFRCPPDHWMWSTENDIGPDPTIVFPRVPVRITQIGRRPVVADANCVMFYNADQSYTRTLLSDRGDACEFFSVSPHCVTQIARDVDPSVQDRPDAPFRFPNGPCSPDTYLRQRKLFEYVSASDAVDPVLVQEVALDVLHRVIADAFVATSTRPRAKGQRTSLAHADSAEAVKQVLNLRFRERLLLDDIAATVHLSPYHLCRVFRRHAGLSVHQYLDQLRLRASLEELENSAIDLTTVALNLGYSSHTHFSFAFRRLFGVPPSAARDPRTRRRLLSQTSKIPTA